MRWRVLFLLRRCAMAASKGPAWLGGELPSALAHSAYWQGEALEQIVREDPDVAFESLGSYSELEVKQLLDLASPPGDFDIDRSIRMYRVLYATTAFDGEQLRVSGRIALPNDGDIRGVVSWVSPAPSIARWRFAARNVEHRWALVGLFAQRQAHPLRP